MRLTSKKTIGLVLAAVALIVAVGLGVSLSGSSQGSITNPPAPKAPAAITQVKASGKYISFSYPSDFGASPTQKASGAELETFAYIKRPSPFYFLNITVSNLPSGNLADDGSYNSRLVQPERYSATTTLIKGQAVKVFSDTSSAYAKAAWLVHDNKDVSVALSTDSADDGLDQILKNVLASVAWH